MARNYHEYDPDYSYGYRRPSISAWVAAMAVAIAVFILGGFVKTYTELETLREESRREINRLREQVAALQAPASAAGGRSHQSGRTRLPPLRNTGPEQTAQAVRTAISSSRRFLDEVDGDRPRLSYSIGRSTRRENGDAIDQTRPPSQVVAVNSGLKRLMVEGGRDAGVEEGARLELSRQGRWIGDLRVTDVFDTMSACEVLHATSSPQPGDAVRLP